jgi:hypothetical protein
MEVLKVHHRAVVWRFLNKSNVPQFWRLDVRYFGLLIIFRSWIEEPFPWVNMESAFGIGNGGFLSGQSDTSWEGSLPEER